MTLYEDLMYRGLIKDKAGIDIEKVINGCDATFYWGTDPTADSLHIGHYSSLITAKRLAKAGHHPILLVGGATSLIGDPRPTAEREIISKETVMHNLEGIKKQLIDIFDGNIEVVNNYDWTKDINILDFLRDIGKYININYMINKDIISRRLETGITFAEFTYTLLQGYDFLYLYEHKNCIMQVEGSDQWGNITTGIELINKKLGKDAYAFTMPLILDSTGKKFGKSEGNALWLDKNKTSSYDIYQYLINSSDEKVEEYLKVFTFLTKEEIENVMASHREKPESRIAQKTLAYEFIKDLHGEEEAINAKKMSEDIFSGNVENMPAVKVANSSYNIMDLLVETGLCSSKSDARRNIEQGGVKVNNEKVTDVNLTISIDSTIIQKGKKNIIKVEN